MKKITLLIISMLLLFTGCTGTFTNNQSEAGSSDSANKGERITSVASWFGGSLENVLYSVGMAKFNENLDMDEWEARLPGLESLTVIYEPSLIKNGVNFRDMQGIGSNSLDTTYDSDGDDMWILFTWHRASSPDKAVTARFNRGAVAEYIEEHNGITYGITEWLYPNSDELQGYGVGWAQYDQRFSAVFPTSFTMPEIFDFCNVVPIHTWELDGDAVSVSIQGVGDVFIVDGEGNVITEEDGMLYRNGNRIGYRWLIDEEKSRHQYVLEPGEYAFDVSGAICKPRLIVKHFAAGKCVSNVDYTKKFRWRKVSRFLLTITPKPEENELLFLTP